MHDTRTPAARLALTQRIPRGTNSAMHARIPGLAIVRRMALLASLALVPALSACGLFEELPPLATPTPSPDNLVQNAGFETGRDPWFSLDQPTWRPFDLGEGVARTGGQSLSLTLRGEEADVATRVVGAVQTLRPAEFPEFLSGFYRVEEWTPNATFQYLQFVVAVHGGNFGDDEAIHQIRFPIAGIGREPFQIDNARFMFLSRGQPEMNAWTYFGFPIKQAFQSKWGAVPSSWEFIEIFFEVRYDSKTAEQGTTSAKVYFDDLYVGPMVSNPNRPDVDRAVAP